ncbi:MAG: lysylphosphatidylglycerol synthase transmembrane domain-containing protein [Bacteroidota bacterium]
MKLKINRHVKSFIKVILSFAALYFVYTKIDIKEVINVYRQSNPFFLVIALLFFTISKIIAAYRLNGYLKAIDIFISETANLRLYLLGMFYNLFLPGGIGGDGYKIYLLNRHFNVKARRIFWAIFFDRLNGVLALVILATLFFYFLGGLVMVKWFLWILIPLGIFVFYYIIRRFFSYFRKIVMPGTFQSLLVQVSQTLSAFFIMLALGIDNYHVAYLFIFLLSSIIAMMPVTIGGIGSREIAFLYGAKMLALNTSVSVALSLMFYLITLLVSFFGIFLSFKPEHILKHS